MNGQAIKGNKGNVSKQGKLDLNIPMKLAAGAPENNESNYSLSGHNAKKRTRKETMKITSSQQPVTQQPLTSAASTMMKNGRAVKIVTPRFS
jgi:hypothetical protein